MCFTSVRGHNNFLYPSQNKLIVKKNCNAQKMAWLGGGSKIAIKILNSNLIPFDITDNTTKNISPPNKNTYIIVWIEKNV